MASYRSDDQNKDEWMLVGKNSKVKKSIKKILFPHLVDYSSREKEECKSRYEQYNKLYKEFRDESIIFKNQGHDEAIRLLGGKLPGKYKIEKEINEIPYDIILEDYIYISTPQSKHFPNLKYKNKDISIKFIELKCLINWDIKDKQQNKRVKRQLKRLLEKADKYDTVPLIISLLPIDLYTIDQYNKAGAAIACFDPKLRHEWLCTKKFEL